MNSEWYNITLYKALLPQNDHKKLVKHTYDHFEVEVPYQEMIFMNYLLKNLQKT